MPRDSGAIDDAIVARLQGDATLAALMPDGVYFGRAQAGKTRFVIVASESGTDEAITFGRPGERANHERHTYVIRAVEKSSTTANTKAAANRIRELLEDQPLTIPGFVNPAIARVDYLRYPEVDAIDQSIVWQHRGGRYRVIAAPIPATN
jgi:Protein of unknown function (DUF3168)